MARSKGGRRSRAKIGGSSQSSSSARWLARQQRDQYTRRAAAEGRTSRAHFKLEQLDERMRLLKPGMRVLELGAAPGGWTRYVEERLQGGRLVVCDFRPVTAGPDTVVITGTCGEPETDAAIEAALDGPVDLVLSDMAPNISGIRAADQARSMELAEIAVAAAERWLKPGGKLVVKVFQGDGIEAWMADMRNKFVNFRLVKPRASRQDSREMYAVAEQFRVAR